MKKIMIGMILTIGAIASFGKCSDNGEDQSCPFGYKLKIMVRTTKTCNRTTGNCGTCGDSEVIKFRKPSTRRFIGLVYGVTQKVEDGCGCSGKSTCACNDWSNAKIALFDYDKQMPVEIESAEILQLNRIGCANGDRNKAEITFSITTKCDDSVATMVFSGFGLCGKHEGNITIGSVSGFCAGLLPAGTIEGCGQCGESACVSGNNIWSICSDEYVESKTTSAYGKWMMIWDPSVVARVGINLTDETASTPYGTANSVAFNKAE